MSRKTCTERTPELAKEIPQFIEDYKYFCYKLKLHAFQKSKATAGVCIDASEVLHRLNSKWVRQGQTHGGEGNGGRASSKAQKVSTNSFPQATQAMASAQQALLSGLVSETRLQCKFIYTHKTQPPALGQISSLPSRNACKGVDIFFLKGIKYIKIYEFRGWGMGWKEPSVGLGTGDSQRAAIAGAWNLKGGKKLEFPESGKPFSYIVNHLPLKLLEPGPTKT